MGEAAEDCLDGTVCQGCGEFFDDILNGGDAPGFPRSCGRCEPKEAAAPKLSRRQRWRRRRREKAQGATQGGAPSANQEVPL